MNYFPNHDLMNECLNYYFNKIEGLSIEQLREKDPVILSEAQDKKLKNVVIDIINEALDEDVVELDESLNEYLDSIPQMFGNFLYKNLEIASHKQFNDELKTYGFFSSSWDTVTNIDDFIVTLGKDKTIRVSCQYVNNYNIEDFGKKVLDSYAQFLLRKKHVVVEEKKVVEKANALLEETNALLEDDIEALTRINYNLFKYKNKLFDIKIFLENKVVYLEDYIIDINNSIVANKRE